MPVNSSYPLKFKEKVAQEAIKGNISLKKIAEKYDISFGAVQSWSKAFIDGNLKQDPKPLTAAQRQAIYKARIAEWEDRMSETQTKARSAFKDIISNLVGAASAYKEFAGSANREHDPLYETRLRIYQEAISRANETYEELFEAPRDVARTSKFPEENN